MANSTLLTGTIPAAACTTYSVGSTLVICGGHGTCTKASTCQCDAGWTSRGDFELAYDTNCDISIDAMKALACLVIILAALSFMLSVYNIANFENYKAVTMNHPKARISITFFLTSVGGLIYGAGRLVDPVVNVVGSEVSTSFGFVFFLVFLDAAWSLLSALFSQFLQGSARVLGLDAQTRISAVVDVVQRGHIYIALANVPFFVFPIVASQLPASSDTVVIAVLVYHAVVIFLIAHQAVRVLKTFNHEMGLYIASATTPPPSLVSLHFNTTILYFVCVGFLCVIAPFCIVIAAVPYLRRKYSYFVMVLIINCLIPSLGILFMQAPKQKSFSYKTAKVVTVAAVAADNPDSGDGHA